MTTSITELGEEQFRKIEKKLRFYCCAECGAELMLSHDEKGRSAFDCTRNWNHKGIAREQSPYEKEGDASLNIQTRREKMAEQYGEEKTRALAKFEGVTSLSKQDANEILTTIYPNAPKTEIQRAMLLCYSYSLNPLMGHVFLIPFKERDRDGKVKGTNFATVLGIKANRLIASRRGAYSYLDGTPRLMTEEEQIKVYGSVQEGYICAVTKLQDPATKAEAPGYGKWKKSDTVYGTDKGNSAENMAFIRSERQALDRLRPGEMPMNVEVMDERFMPRDGNGAADRGKAEEESGVIDAEATVIDEEPEEKPATNDNPADWTVDDLKSFAKENGWILGDIGKYANSDDRGALGGWGIRDLNDLTPEQIGELLDYIQKHPKKK
jgi:hypothetical protein